MSEVINRHETYGVHAQPRDGSRSRFNTLVKSLVDAGRRDTAVMFFGALWIDRTPELDGGWIRDPGDYQPRHQRRSLNMSPFAPRPDWQVVRTYIGGRYLWFRTGQLPGWLSNMDPDDFAAFGGREIHHTLPLLKSVVPLAHRVAIYLDEPTIPKEARTHG